MKIWRKDSTKPINEEVVEKSEELTDISQASTPKVTDKKDKMEEIYSTKDKQVKYKRLTPLEAEEAAKRTKSAKEKLASGEAEISLETPLVPDKIVELTSDYEEGTVIAQDIIEEVDDFSSTRTIHLQDIDDIDIDLDSATALKKYERQIMSTKRHEERQKSKSQLETDWLLGKGGKSKSTKIVAKIPVYQHESKINKVHLKAGRFTDVVEREYDEYLKSNDPTISKRESIIGKVEPKQSLLYTLSQLAAHKSEPKKTQQTDKADIIAEHNLPDKKIVKKKPKSKIRKFLKIVKSLILPKKAKGTAEQTDKSAPTIDYQKRQDAKHVATQINSNLKKLIIKTLLFVLLFVLSLALSIIQSVATTTFWTNFTPSLYCCINLIIIVATGVIAKPFILSGLKPLKKFAGNSDTAMAYAYIACLIQQIFSIFYAKAFVDSTFHLYTTIITLGFVFNTIGRIIMVSRVKANFSFLTSKNPAYAAKIFNDEDTARKMLSGTIASRSVIAYQHKTDFLSDFLKISYAPDPSEDSVSKIAPITIVSSLFVGVVYGITSHSFIGALCALAVMSCISIPVCILLAGNIPLLLFCKDNLKNNAMVSGYPSVRQFCDSDAVMVNARQLYPKDCVKINTINYYADFRVEESLISAAAILKEAKSPLRFIFDKVIEDSHLSLPKVESALYEDKLGLVGWVNGERLLIGSRKLLDRYHIYMGDCDDETDYTSSGKDVTYIACSGQLVAMVVTTYTPDEKIKEELKKAQSAGLCFIVSTTDCNITQEKIANDYQIFYRSVKVLSTGFANTCTQVCSEKEENSRAYLATKGKFTSLIHAVSGAIMLRHNLTIGVVIQIFGLILGVLLCATMVLYASVSILSVFEMLLYILFWGIAAIVAQLIKRK